MSFILGLSPEKKIFLGSIKHASSKEFLQENQISIIINCAKETKNFFQDSYKYFNIPIEDSELINISNYFDDCHQFVLDNMNVQGNILIHCIYGVSRSATVTIALLMKFADFNCQQSQKIVEIRRPEISPNNGFLQQLDIYSQALQSQQNTQQANHQTEEQKDQIQSLKLQIKNYILNQANTDFLCNYKCKKCKAEIMKSVDITHGTSIKCNSFYITYPSWIPEDNIYKNDSVIYCFKCQAKLGAQKLSGLMCSCSEWIAPAYQIQKFKVDRKTWDSINKQWV